jgi:hypothetical protein
LEIRWPSGERHLFSGLAADQIIALKEDERDFRRVK